MKLTTSNYFGPEVDEFRRSLASFNQNVLVEHEPPAPVQFAGPAELVQISIDPQTLRLIFDYVTTLVATSTFTLLLKKFLEGLAEESGKYIGGKITGELALLWKRLHNRVRAKQYVRIYLGFRFNVENCPVEIDDSLFPTHLATISQEDEMRAFCLIMFRLIPILNDFTSIARKNDVKLTKISAQLLYFEKGKWHWSVEILPIGTFRLEPDGIIRPAYDESECGLGWWTQRRLRKQGIQSRDIETMMVAYRRKHH